MLPGFRFLFAAIVLSMSMLVFGLGAAALLRAAHEEFASTPSWRAAPENMFAQQAEATPPVLAMLRVDMPAAEPKSSDDVPAVARADEAEPVASVPTLAAPEKIALKAEDAPPPQTAKPENLAAEAPAQSGSAPALADAPTAADQTKIAATGEVLAPANEAAPAAASEQSSEPAAVDADLGSARIATLGGPPVAIEPPPTAGAEPDKNVTKKRQQARREHQHHRIAARAQQPVDPFAPTVAPARRR